MTETNINQAQESGRKINPVLAVRACRICKHSEIQFKTDLYCMNSECDEEFSHDSECDNYMGIVNPDDECRLFEPLA